MLIWRPSAEVGFCVHSVAVLTVAGARKGSFFDLLPSQPGKCQATFEPEDCCRHQLLEVGDECFLLQPRACDQYLPSTARPGGRGPAIVVEAAGAAATATSRLPAVER